MTTPDGQKWFERIRSDADGSLPAYAWPGGYPVLYIASDGETFCPRCVNTEPEVELVDEEEMVRDGSGWEIVGWFIHYEGPAEVCCNCGEETASAYGDPDELDPVVLWEGSAGARALLPDADEDYSGPQQNGGA